MAAFIDPILRGSLFVYLAILLGLIGSLIADQSHVNPQVNFGIFATVFGLVFGVFYGLGAAFVEFLAFPIVIAIFDFLNFVFLFAAATAIATALRVHSCNNKSYVDHNTVAQGSSGRCRRAQASVAFLYFSAFTILGLFIYSTISVFSQGAFSLPTSRRSAAPRTGIPTMSQV
ncbi:Nce102p [Sugiyamaella lignohabitans]|uniref:Nce102p n=1 Tax=Sugiyamaella lignohabitans TaxID=796027 RepID=A0A161HGL5_9ASCO|nr:Nce102p [Sugiyamaella lignohabitans]ANB14920.1 Nce102p [Sugiyamaella lignohabitans]